MKQKYDLAFSLGAACACSQMLRLAGLQYASFPYDWIGGVSFMDRISLLESGFAGWPRPEDFRVAGTQPNGWPVVEDARWHFTYLHDFPPGSAVERQCAAVCEKYVRRQKRLTSLIASARRVLAVYVGLPEHTPEPLEHLVEARARLERRFAPARFDLLCFDCPAEVDFADRKDFVAAPGVRRISFDYRDYRPGKQKYEAAYGFLARHFMRGYAVRDYRSPQERERYKAKQRAKALVRFGASGAVGLFINRLEYRIWRHFAKMLSRKGIDCGLASLPAGPEWP